ncbi:hypothetical protein AA0118_g865 [Alternaria tenuissima]|uniref:Uncharacterized protein n=1 Tax=Alternaria tenuissima TaxID=119927 RepID=A0A4Q4MC49_9PLEO|nr:hypothetical protein AA0114_g7602 [Alternaria tenuissima]RYN68944.1 hypothetical protein AA0118_g865 [Alternaria tenuissima]RYO55862.1 hypothetical protein AA0116_g8484 [Alternaria tenuissima]
MSIDGTPAGWPFDSVEEWALFQYALYPEQGYYLGFEPYDSDRDRESSEEDWEEWSKMQNAEFENEHLDHDRATNDLQQQQHHDQNDVSSESEAQADAEIAESIGMIALEDKVQLTKTIKDGIDRCKQAMEIDSAKLKQDIQNANRSFHAEIDLMNEWHERIKAQDLILDKRKEIHVRLPTNQVITPAHNALVDEDAKEGILIAESFGAIKTEKANIRAKLASQVEKAEDTFKRDSVTLSTQIECLRNVAESSGIDLDTGFDEYVFRKPVIGVQSSTQVQGPSSTRSRQSNTANANKGQESTVPIVSVVEEDCFNYGRIQEELFRVNRIIDRIQDGASIPDMRKFIKYGELVLSELVHHRDSADEAAAKGRQDTKLSKETALDDLVHEQARIKKIHVGVGHLWEHDNQGLWQETYDLCREEIVSVKKELQALENLDFRCEEKVNKRHWDSKELLVKQIKFYNSLLSLAKRHFANR